MQIAFSTDDVPLRDRVPFFLDVLTKQIFSLTATKRPDPGMYRARLRAQVAGRFALLDLQTVIRAFQRTAADVARDNTNKFFLIRAGVESVSHTAPVRATAEEIRSAPGDFCIGSAEWQADVAAREGFSCNMLLIPHGLLSPLLTGGRLTRMVAVTSHSPLGSLLGTALDATTTQLPHLSPDLGDAVLQNLCGLIALACGLSEQGRSSGCAALRAARLEAVKRYIEQHLNDPGLTPASAAASLGISERQLHLLFEPTGTSFARHVTRQRLQACRAALATPTSARRSVADIALGWGFNSMATFYRAFQSEFGAPPAAVRATAD